MAIFGVEDQYARRVDSLWNNYVNRDQKQAEPTKHAVEDSPRNPSDTDPEKIESEAATIADSDASLDQ